MQVDDPPYLSVGTGVSAKYKGAFCEAKVSKVTRIVKCKVTYKMGLGNATLSDEQIKGTLRVGQVVQAKHPDRKELVEATITKIQDCSQYTVVFDDGDITTLKRSALCIKSGRHFNESESLDQLPLTHPEHFSSPVVGSNRRGRRNRQLKDDDSEEEIEEENEPDLEGYVLDIGRVVSVESSDKKKSKDNWFPGLVVIPSAQPTVRINIKEEFLVRSFKDGRYYTVPKKEVIDFRKEMSDKVESAYLSEAIQKALRFMEHNELPPHWEKRTLFHSSTLDSDSEEIFSDSSDDEPCEEKDRFVAQLYKFLDEAGTPLNKTPTIASRDVDLHKLFRVVQKLGGFNKVTNQNKWRTVTMKLRFPNTQNIINQVKAVYKKCLSSYEIFYRTLGVTMLNHTPSSRKDRGRSLIRDKDRTTPINPPTLEKEEDSPGHDKKEESNRRRSDKKRLNHVTVETSDREVDNSESKDSGKTGKDRTDSKSRKDKKKGEKVKTLIEKFEEHAKKAEDDKVQNTRSKSQPKSKEPPGPPDKKSETKPQTKASAKTPKKASPTVSEDEKKKGKKRTGDEKSSDLKSDSVNNISIGDKLKVYYGPTHESKVTYEAKVIEIDKESSGPIYLVHYTGWNTRYDEWIQPQRIAENLSASTKAKRLKQGVSTPLITSKPPPTKPSTASGKTKRVSSGNNRVTAIEAPRSTTPSSVTSSGSRTKSPAVPATRSVSRLTRRDSSRQKDRRISTTDTLIPTESESEESDSESDMVTTRSGLKTEDTEIKTYRRRNVKSVMTKTAEKKRENDTDKEEDTEKPQKRSKRLNKKSDKSAEESEDEGNPPKGRDFDLNQIRSELKGFSKAIKVANIDTSEKDVFSSDDSTNPPILENLANVVEEDQEQIAEEKEFEKVDVDESKSLQSSEDIYEFKEPEPFEFETRSKLNDDKNNKKRMMPRIFEELEKSPKKKSPKMSPKQESPDRKSYKRSPLKRQDSSDEEETILPMSPPNEQDPFDKLIESPSFNLVKTVDKQITQDKNKIDGVVRNLNSDDSLSLFRDLPETEDDCSKDMELSDCESQTQIFTRESEIFSEGFSSKPSPDHNTMDMEFSSGKTDESKMKDFDDEDLQKQIQRVIAQSSSTDDDSSDLLMVPSTTSYRDKNKESDPIPTITSILGISPTATVVVPRHDKNYEEFSKVTVQEEEVISSPAIVSPVADKLPPVEELSFIEKKSGKTPDREKSPVTDELPAAEDSTEREQDLSIIAKTFPSADEPADSKASTSTNEEIKEKTSDIDHPVDPEKISSIIEAPFSKIEKHIISPALQETDSALLESIVSETPISLDVKLEETAKELSSVKTGTKIADSILQKINSINEMRCKSPDPEKETNEKNKTNFTFEIPREDTKHITAESELPKEQSCAIIIEDEQSKQRDKRKTKTESSADVKKKKVKTSKAFIEETESDSSDSEQLIIARSDEDSQSNTLDMNISADIKEGDSSNTFINAHVTDDSQSKEERNFNFDHKDIVIEQNNEPIPEPVENEYMDTNTKPLKEDEPDPHLHSLLLCEEEIPRSPAPPTENIITEETKPNSEMPFASAPGSSSTNKNIILEQNCQKRIVSPIAMEVPLAERAENSTIMDNTPPTTPESTISNLSPRNERIDISPNHGDESKSNDIESDYPRQKRNLTLKVSSYSEEDTQMTGDQALLNKKTNQDIIHQQCKKRRKSLRNSDDSAPPPLKKSKKSLNRSRQNSDSDTSEHSNGAASASSTKMSSFSRGDRSPRPSKYNFFVELDPNLDSAQRIAVLTQKLSELRKTYADVKAELATVERRRKKIKRREREALKAAKQEMACA